MNDEVVEDLLSLVCDSLCKYPIYYDPEEMSVVCDDCPLVKKLSDTVKDI